MRLKRVVLARQDRRRLMAALGDLCERLLSQGCPGLHFYTMNQAAPSLALWQRLDLSSR